MFKKRLIKLLIVPSVLFGSIGCSTLLSEAAQPKEQPKVEVQKTDEDMVEKVKSILSKYAFSTLTEEEANTIVI